MPAIRSRRARRSGRRGQNCLGETRIRAAFLLNARFVGLRRSAEFRQKVHGRTTMHMKRCNRQKTRIGRNGPPPRTHQHTRVCALIGEISRFCTPINYRIFGKVSKTIGGTHIFVRVKNCIGRRFRLYAKQIVACRGARPRDSSRVLVNVYAVID